MSNFIEDCIQGQALLDDVDDYVDRWHESESDTPLHAYLGMSEAEYSLWMAQASALPFIVVAHRQRRNVRDVLNEFQSTRLAARSDGPDKAAARGTERRACSGFDDHGFGRPAGERTVDVSD